MESSPLPMFHDGPVCHSHQACNHCFQIQRSHAKKLLHCARCTHVAYCSKECQIAAWPAHKQACKLLEKERLLIEKESSLSTPIQDFHAWVTYYNMPLQNCTIAMMDLPQRPHLERLTVLALCLRHKRDPSLPVWDRFEVASITRMEAAVLAAKNPSLGLDPGFYAKICEKGKIEMGSNFYGMGRYYFAVAFTEQKIIEFEYVRHFAISREVARAQSLHDKPWLLLREYISIGAKVRFCCGKLRNLGLDDVCCCGGWVHDAEKRNAFASIK
ncbi:hypothetical protein C8R47DRAFT_1312987 [Mycena vitilis]|nr:hypothetical protein C8R47DRAFT_1312987 [Mycena vitilis]